MATSNDILERVEAAISSIRPFLNADGGDMQLLEVTEDMVARIALIGACSTCNMSHMTMRNGVEEAIRRTAPEIKSVEAVFPQ